MYYRITMEADYEPWWDFDDREEKYKDVQHFETFEQYEIDMERILTSYRQKYTHEKSKEGRYFAFWNDGETAYCEGCDEDLQIYKGIIFSHSITSKVK